MSSPENNDLVATPFYRGNTESNSSFKTKKIITVPKEVLKTMQEK